MRSSREEYSEEVQGLSPSDLLEVRERKKNQLREAEKVSFGKRRRKPRV